MSVSPEVMQGLMGGGGSGPPPDAGPGPAPPAPDAGPDPGSMPGPGGSPMMTPQVPSGQIQVGKIQAVVGMRMLEKALVSLGSHTEEGKCVLKALQSMTKVFGKDAAESSDLLPSERKSIAGTLPGGPDQGAPPAGGPPPGMPPPGMGGGMPPPGMG